MRLIAIAAALSGLAACASPEYRDTDVAMVTEEPVDLSRYMGRWYEIARFPNSFEEGCVGVTADYALNDDGSVRVVNSCRQGSLSGPVETAEGRAVKANAAGDRLKVSFVPWLPFAAGDYWILDVTDDYQVAVVGNPAGTTGWILARTPQLGDARRAAAEDVLRRNGYDTKRLIAVQQRSE